MVSRVTLALGLGAAILWASLPASGKPAPRPPAFVRQATADGGEQLFRRVRGGLQQVTHLPEWLTPPKIRALKPHPSGRWVVIEWASGKNSRVSLFEARTNLTYRIAGMASAKLWYDAENAKWRGSDLTFRERGEGETARQIVLNVSNWLRSKGASNQEDRSGVMAALLAYSRDKPLAIISWEDHREVVSLTVRIGGVDDELNAQKTKTGWVVGSVFP